MFSAWNDVQFLYLFVVRFVFIINTILRFKLNVKRTNSQLNLLITIPPIKAINLLIQADISISLCVQINIPFQCFNVIQFAPMVVFNFNLQGVCYIYFRTVIPSQLQYCAAKCRKTIKLLAENYIENKRN